MFRLASLVRVVGRPRSIIRSCHTTAQMQACRHPCDILQLCLHQHIIRMLGRVISDVKLRQHFTVYCVPLRNQAMEAAAKPRVIVIAGPTASGEQPPLVTAFIHPKRVCGPDGQPHLCRKDGAVARARAHALGRGHQCGQCAGGVCQAFSRLPCEPRASKRQHGPMDEELSAGLRRPCNIVCHARGGVPDVVQHIPHINRAGLLVNVVRPQVYRGLDVGSAKQPVPLREGVPHHLARPCSVTHHTTTSADSCLQ